MANDNLKIVLQLDAKGNMSKSVKNVNGQLNRFKSASQKATAGSVRLEKSLNKLSMYGHGAALAFLSQLTIGKFLGEVGEFETSVKRLQATSSATANQMNALQTQARELGSTSVFSAKQAADAQTFLAQAGFKVNEILSATPKVMQLAVAGNLDLANAADLASNVLGGMNLEVSEFGRVNDILAKTASSSNTNIQQLGVALSYAAPVASAAGISLEATSAAIGKLGDSGIQGTRAGTAVIGMIRTLSKVTPKAEEALGSYGISLSDVDIKSRGLSNVLKTLQKANISAKDSFEIFGSEVAPAANILANSALLVDELTQTLNIADGSAKKMADTMSGGLINSQKAFKSALSESVLSLNDYFNISESASSGLVGLSNSLNSFSQSLNKGELDAFINLIGVGFVLATTSATAKLGQLGVAKVSDTLASRAAQKAELERLQSLKAVALAEHRASITILQKAHAQKIATAGTYAGVAAERAYAAASANARTSVINLKNATQNYSQIAAKSSMVATGLRGAMSLLGGPLGIGLAIASFGAYAFASKEAEVNTQEMIDRVSSLTGKYDELGQSQTRQALKQINADIEMMRTKVFTSQDKSLWDVMFGDADAAREKAAKEFKAFQSLVKGKKDLEAKLLNSNDAGTNPKTSNSTQQNQAIIKLKAESEKEWIDAVKQYHKEYQDELDAEKKALKEQIALKNQLAETKRTNQIQSQYEDDMRAFDKLDAQDQSAQDLTDSIDGYQLSVRGLGDAWRETGDAATKSLLSMIETQNDYDKQQKASAKDQTKLNELKAENLKQLEKGFIDKAQYEKSATELAIKQSEKDIQVKQNQRDMYMALGSAAANGFAEGSAAAEAYGLVVKAMAVQDGIGATIKAWNSAPFPANMPAVALTGGAVAALLSQMGESINTSGGGSSVADVENRQATGSGVLGGGKTESVNKSWENLHDINANQYRELQGIYTEMQDLNDNIIGVVRASYAGGDFTNLASATSSNMASDSFAASTLYGGSKAAAGGYGGLLLGAATGWLGSMIAGGLAGTALGDTLFQPLDNVVGGAINTVFGGIKKSRSDYGYSIGGTLGDTNVGGFETIKKSKDGGWFKKSSTSYSDNAIGIDSTTAQAFDLVFQNIADSTIKLGNELDRNVTDAVNSYEISIGKISASGDSAEFTKQLNEAFSAQSDKLANEMFGDIINGYRQVNESAFETLSRVVTEKVATADILDQTGLKMVGDAVAVSQSLVSLAGGVKELQSSANTYIDKFFTDEEKFTKLTENLNETFGDINKSLPANREGFRAVVESLDITTKSGQEAYVALTSASDMADQYYKNLEDNAKAAQDASEAALKAAQDAVTAAESSLMSAYGKFTDQADAIKSGLLALVSDEAALAYQRGKELATIDPLLKAQKQRLWALQDEAAAIDKAKAAQSSYQSTLSGVLSSLGGAFSTIKQFTAALVLGASATGATYASTLSLAQSGDQTALSSITQSAQAYLDDTLAKSSTKLEYDRAKASVINDLTALPDQVSAQQYIADEIKKAIETQTETLSFDYAQSLKNNFDALIPVVGETITQAEFKSIYSGTATDEVLRKVFNSIAGTDGLIDATDLTTSALSDPGGTTAKTDLVRQEAEKQVTELSHINESTAAQLEAIGGLTTQLGANEAALKQSIETEKAKVERARLEESVTKANEAFKAVPITEERITEYETKKAAADATDYDVLDGLYEIEIDKKDAAKIKLLAGEISHEEYLASSNWQEALLAASAAVGADHQLQVLENALGTENISDYYAKQKALTEAQAAFDAFQMPTFATGGIHTGGVRLVGEQGPELEFTGPSRIVNNQQTKGLLDHSDIIAEIRAMRLDLAELQAENNRLTLGVANHAYDTATSTNRIYRDGVNINNVVKTEAAV